ncbi:MAG TPA: transcriptional regulator [Syntrophobacteraceae bacterium]|jgi:DNA-binding transcriptional ArsR family regulator|nr:transcriptional regulator [Syntrophobacteraceae bacterium]
MAPEGCNLTDLARLEEAAGVLKAVAHPVRLRIVELLEPGEMTVTELLTCLGTQQAYTSQQLNILKAKGVVAARRQGNQIYYSIANPGAIKVIHCIRGQNHYTEEQRQSDGNDAEADRSIGLDPGTRCSH